MSFINKYDKRFFEKYALFSICHLLNIDINNFVDFCDKPDLQSKIYNLGIEVVQAITKHDGLTHKIINSYFGKGLSGTKIISKINNDNRKAKFSGSIRISNGYAVISPTKGLYDSEKHRELLVNKIEEKSIKFKKYKHFETNGLYCFSHTGLLDEYDYKYIINACKRSPFSIVFINCIDTILLWKAPFDKFVTCELSTEMLHKWKQDAYSI